MGKLITASDLRELKDELTELKNHYDDIKEITFIDENKDMNHFSVVSTLKQKIEMKELFIETWDTAIVNSKYVTTGHCVNPNSSKKMNDQLVMYDRQII